MKRKKIPSFFPLPMHLHAIRHPDSSGLSYPALKERAAIKRG
jgi:hypothetical protein